MAILNVLIIFILLSAIGNTQTTYEIGLGENDEFVWEIKELDLDKFQATFGTEPNFEVGSQVRMIIREVDDIQGYRWSIVAEFWDYGTDWGVAGSIESLSIQRYPSQYDDYIIIPTPVSNYIEDAIETLSSQYYSYSSNLIGRQDVSDLGVEYKVEKTFNIDGVLTSETYLDEADLIIVKLEATFQFIPFGFGFLGFMAIGIVGLIIFTMKRKLSPNFKI